MSEFSVSVVRVGPVTNHPNADRLTCAQIAGYVCVSNKLDDGSPRYAEGDLAVYIPEGSVLPEWLLRQLDMWNEEHGKGILSGSLGNRVKAIRLRGIVSQGILHAVNKSSAPNGHYVHRADGAPILVSEGDDVTSALGIVKYEPPIPSELRGKVVPAYGFTDKFDFESIQKDPGLFEPGEPVNVTEKLHGTFIQIGWHPSGGAAGTFAGDRITVSSKSMAKDGLSFAGSEPGANVYVRTLEKLISDGIVEKLELDYGDADHVFIMGEVFGMGIQDLHYGRRAPSFRAFDVLVDRNGARSYAPLAAAAALGLEFVPVLYDGPYDSSTLVAIRDGKDSISGTHVREGIVIRSLHADAQHRKIAKWVSPDYLTRKGGTEFN